MPATRRAMMISPATALPSPFLRTAAVLTFVPALPLCITHGALSHDLVPAIGLVPLFFSAGISLFLLLRSRRGRRSKESSLKGNGRWRSGGRVREDLEGLLGAAADAGAAEESDGGEESEGGEAAEGRSGIEPEDSEEDEVEGGNCGSVLTHRILVFVADVILAASLMVVLVFTWIRTGNPWDRRPKLAMLAAYGTIPLLANFLIHLYLAAREFVAGLAIPSLVEYTAWRVVSPDCPYCGSRLRPDSFPSIPWYETVSRPKVSLPRINTPSFPRPPLPEFGVPKFSGLKGPGDWKVPSWLRGRELDASLFVDDEQTERDRYRDDPDTDVPFDAPSGRTTVVATGSAHPAPVEEVVVGKRDRRDVMAARSVDEDGYTRP